MPYVSSPGYSETLIYVLESSAKLPTLLEPQVALQFVEQIREWNWSQTEVFTLSNLYSFKHNSK